MRVKQVFKTYNNLKHNKIKDKFCPLCGRECVLKPDNGTLRMTCVNCGHVQYHNPSPAVSILIVDNLKFLLCRRSVNQFQGGKWCLPCGFIEFNEDYLSAAVREVKEETGL
jgi:8-oxo-dGTP diphosphatase